MLNILEDQLLADVVSRAEQSRFSYTLQTEEFRNLNSNLQIYLNDIKITDDENRHLQDNIDQIRTDYIITLENHLKRLPEDFRHESQTLTEAHLERYKSKSRAKRFSNEREEFKKRINFILSNEKEQTKRLNNLQKQERFVHNEFKILNEQIHNLYNSVQKEKQTHQQAMEKVDQLQIQLEKSTIERSKTEFEIQTLREEVKLMQTAKEFLDEEQQTILSTQTEANEYLLSRLNDSISRIREDFNELNKTQLKQLENEYKKMMKILEEKVLADETSDEAMINHQRIAKIEYEKLQDEHQSMTQELTTLNDHHDNLSEQILILEGDLYSIRDERLRELITKDNELERNQIELQTLNEKLNHLAEYDRNLKFELTLYRGVLENEYRRKQQQISNNQQAVRPTTLRTTTIRSNKNLPVGTNRNQLGPIGEKISIQLNETVSTTNHFNDEKVEKKDEVAHQERNLIAEEEHQTSTETAKSPISTVPVDQLTFSRVQQSPTISSANQEASLTSNVPPPDLSSSSSDHQISSKISNVPTSPTNPTFPDDQPESSEAQQSSIISPTNQEASLTSSVPPPDPSSPSNDRQIPSETTSIAASPTNPTLLEDQPASFGVQQSPAISPTNQEASLTSSVPPADLPSPSSDRQIPSETASIPTSPTNPTLPEDQPASSGVQKSSATSPMNQERALTSNVPSPDVSSPSSDRQTVVETTSIPTSPTNLTVSEDQSALSEIQKSPATSPTNQDAPLTSSDPPSDLSSPSNDRQIESETSDVPILSSDPTLSVDQPASSDIRQSSGTYLEDQTLPENPSTNEETSLTSSPPISSEDHQTSADIQKLSSTSSPTGSEIPSESQGSITAPTVSKDQQESSQDQQLSSAQPVDQEESSEVHELSTASPMDEDILSEIGNSLTSPINTAPPTDLSPSTLSDDHQMVSDAQQWSNTSSNEQPMLPESSSKPSQEDRAISSDTQQNASTPTQKQPTSSEIQQPSMTDDDVQEQPSSVATNEYETATPVIHDTSASSTSKGVVDSENQLAEASDEYDNTTEQEEKTSSSTYEIAEVANDRHLSMQDYENNQTDEEDSFSSDLPNISQEEPNQNRNSSKYNKSTLERNQSITIEEPISFSNQNQIEENSKIDYISSTGYYSTINDSTQLNKQSSDKVSLTDAENDSNDLIGEVDSSTSPKIQENESDDNNQSNLEAVMQDLRYVYRSLVNNEDLVEIDDDFPENLIDRLEFGDNLIRTLFDDLLKKYIVEPAKTEIRSKTLDWIEFRDILFPILTGRFTERHIRKLFHLFDTSNNGYLSLHEIIELLELLQINNTTQLAQNIINQDGKSNVDKLIEAFKKVDDANNNILSDDIEYKQWYIQQPTDEENNDTQSISLEVPIVNFPTKISNEIRLLSRIFTRVGADFENRQLDSNKPALSMKITNEFIHNNINISNDDLQLFIELYLNKKQNSDYLINWIEFRDVFLPFVNGGMISKDDIIRWFDIFDINHNKKITHEQLLHFLRLLQFPDPEQIFNKISDLFANKNDSWVVGELIFALETLDETTTHFLSPNEQITSSDLD